jgi:hypothetical protein
LRAATIDLRQLVGSSKNRSTRTTSRRWHNQDSAKRRDRAVIKVGGNLEQISQQRINIDSVNELHTGARA